MMEKQSGRLMTTWPAPTAHSDFGMPATWKVTSSPMPTIRYETVMGAMMT